jgi:hypothetical protein
MYSVIARPIYSRTFRISNIRYVINVALQIKYQRLSHNHLHCHSSVTTPSQVSRQKYPVQANSEKLIDRETGDKQTMQSISPQTTFCLNNPALFFSTKKPSLPATKSLHSSPNTFNTPPAFLVCSLFNPNIIHFPIRALVWESQRALDVSVGWGAS